YHVPVVADIHFTPNAAEMAARIVEKVRVNPGNYADKKKFEEIEYTQSAYNAELERINKKFVPLIRICKEYGTAMRIGTNHGSLSDRIMSHYGDTPQGMVESAMEFMRMCEAENFYNLVISMKASNTQVMVQAYRLLVKTMVSEGMNYPLHLGVTEAGDGEDGRIKSAVGIGTLLEDGLGDTIRVSLTEEPEAEIPVARYLADRYNAKSRVLSVSSVQSFGITYSPYQYTRRQTDTIQNIGGHIHPVVMIDISGQNLKDPFVLGQVGYKYDAVLDKYNLADQAVDIVYLGSELPSFSFPGNLKLVYDHATWKKLADKGNCYPMLDIEEADQELDALLNFVVVKAGPDSLEKVRILTAKKNIVLILTVRDGEGMPEQRKFLSEMLNAEIRLPVILKRTYK
ncbi:MAG: 1-hydroxy-2-methyl-2-(E)-butenyl 4-diphosphate synthase, partial [Sphingobacteriales bacterium]